MSSWYHFDGTPTFRFLVLFYTKKNQGQWRSWFCVWARELELGFDVTETIKAIWRGDKRIKVKGPKL